MDLRTDLRNNSIRNGFGCRISCIFQKTKKNKKKTNQSKTKENKSKFDSDEQFIEFLSSLFFFNRYP